jgi:CTD kinase subunit alpha
MNPARFIKPSHDDTARSPSPPRPIPSYDSGNTIGPVDGPVNVRDALPLHGMRGSDAHRQYSRSSRQRLDTRQYSKSPQYATPTTSHRGSPPPSSPYRSGRGGRSGEQSGYSGHGSVRSFTSITLS